MTAIVRRRGLFLRGRLAATLLCFSLSVAAAFIGAANAKGAKTGAVTIDDVLAASCSAYPFYPARPVWLADQDKLIVQPSKCSKGADAAGSEMLVIDLADGGLSNIGEGKFPHVSPNGEWLAFVAADDAGTSLKVKSLLTGDERSIHRFSFHPSLGYDFAMAWSQSGDRLAFAFRKAPITSKPAKTASTAIVYGKNNLPIGSEVYVYTIQTGASERLASSSGQISGLAWAEGDRRLLVASSYLGHAVAGGEAYARLDSIEIERHAREMLREHVGVLPLLMHPMVSPQGDLIAVEDYVEDRWLTTSQTQILDFDGRHIATIEGKLEGWSGDSNAIYVRRRDGAYDALYRVTFSGGTSRISRDQVSARSIARSASGDRIAWVEIDALGGRFVMTGTPSGRSISVAFDDSPMSARLETVSAQEMCWTSIDEAHLCGLVISPRAGAKRRNPRPLIVDVHGGPAGGLYMGGAMVVRTPLEWQLWVNRGYVVFVPEYRSSGMAGVGPVLATRSRGTFLVDNVRDVMSGVDKLIQDGVVDPDRMAILGHSFGATIVNFLLTQTNRFRVALSKEGLADLYHDSTFSDKVTEWLFNASPWQNRQRYLKNSATYFAGCIRTPVLFIRGSDSKIPAYHSQFLFRTLRSNKVDTEMVAYIGEGHVLENRQNRRDAIERTLSWVDERIGLSRATHFP